MYTSNRLHHKHTVKLLASMIRLRQQSIFRISFLLSFSLFSFPFRLIQTTPKLFSGPSLVNFFMRIPKVGFRRFKSRTWCCGENTQHLGRRLCLCVCVCLCMSVCVNTKKKKEKMSVAYSAHSLSAFPEQFSKISHHDARWCLYVCRLHGKVSALNVCCRIFRQWATRGVSRLLFCSSTLSDNWVARGVGDESEEN